MNLKQELLATLDAEQLKGLCIELELEADRRSPDAMVDALSSAKRAKPELLIVKLTVAQLRAVLRQFRQSPDGSKEELVQRLLLAGGRASLLPHATTLAAGEQRMGNGPMISREARGQASRTSDLAAEYRHRDQAVQRPEAGVQDQFQAKKQPRVYRYDSSLDPALSWDEQRQRDLGEWLLGLIVHSAKDGEAAVFAEPQIWQGGGVRVSTMSDAAQMLKQISKPFLNWTGKPERHEIAVPTTPLFVHERHSTKAVLDGIRHRKARGQTLDLFGDTQLGIHETLEAYQHKGPWRNRMILGDSLAVMNSLLEFENMSGQVQMIYIDPPYGVKFGSNFQPFVRRRDVKHGGDDHMTREPEMVKAYRDTWELGLHSYLTYLRDRLAIARELLHQTGSVFVQISDDNLHHVREVMDEVFGSENFSVIINFVVANAQTGDLLENNCHYLVHYTKDKQYAKYRAPLLPKSELRGGQAAYRFVLLPDGTQRPLTKEERNNPDLLPSGSRIFRADKLMSSHPPGSFPVEFEGRTYIPKKGYWSTGEKGMAALKAANRLIAVGETLSYVRFIDDFPAFPIGSQWNDTVTSGFTSEKLYAVQTNTKVVQRCVLMATDPGDLVLDPTCGSGTTAYVAEQWGKQGILGADQGL
jgi:adenine-specific DNA-methyltransferase